mgnify:CR=1 FL=1
MRELIKRILRENIDKDSKKLFIDLLDDNGLLDTLKNYGYNNFSFLYKGWV